LVVSTAALSEALPEPDRGLVEAAGRAMSVDEITRDFRECVDAL
jgi:hypothetical protein